MPRGFLQIQEEEDEDEDSSSSSSSSSCLARRGLGVGVGLPSPPLTPPLLLALFTATLSSLQFGYHIGVINAPQKVLEGEYNSTWVQRWGSAPPPSTISTLWALSVAIFSVGGMASALGVGELADRLGRKGALLAVNGLAVVGGALMGGAKLGPTYTLIIIGRFLVGLYSGLASGLVPMYVGEISPPALRGALGALHQFGIVCGILGAQVLGLGWLLGSAWAWPALLGAGLLPAALQLLLLPLCPESPSYLLGQGHRASAKRGLSRLWGSAWAELALPGLEEELRGHSQRVSLLQLCRSPRHRQPLLVTLLLQLAQQLSGINAIFYYSTSIFEGAGLAQPAYATIGTGVVNVAATALSVVLLERAGRRLLELLGLLGMMSCAIALSVTLSLPARGGPWGALSVLWVLLFVACFALGPGPIPWFLGAELFGPDTRPPAMALAALANWATNFGVALGFPAMQRALGPLVFLVFGGLLGGFSLFTYLRVPETRGRPFGVGGGSPQPPQPPEKADTELQSLAGGGGGGEEEEP